MTRYCSECGKKRRAVEKLPAQWRLKPNQVQLLELLDRQKTALSCYEIALKRDGDRRAGWNLKQTLGTLRDRDFVSLHYRAPNPFELRGGSTKVTTYRISARGIVALEMNKNARQERDETANT